jgi:hypothetical protein
MWGAGSNPFIKKKKKKETSLLNKLPHGKYKSPITTQRVKDIKLHSELRICTIFNKLPASQNVR